MIRLISERPVRILRNKKRLEEVLDVSISKSGREILIEGNAEKEYIAEKVLKALEFDFPFEDVLDISRGADFEVLNLKDYTSSKDMERVRARIIGKKGKTLKTLSDLTKCYVEIKDNEVGIIGPAECMQNALNAFISLAQGSKTGNVYANLEKNQPKPVWDLGLKRKDEKV